MALREVDIAVIGAGGGGFAATLTAAEAGASVALFEAADVVGGTYAFSAGQVWAAGTRQEREAGIQDSIEQGIAHVRRLSAGRHDDAILQAYMTELPRVLDYLESSYGVAHDVIRNYPDYYAEMEGGMPEGRYLVPTTFDRHSLPEEWRDRLVIAPMYKDIPASYAEVMEWGGFGSASHWDWDMLAERKRAGIVGFGSSSMGHMLHATLEAGVPVELEHRLIGLERAGEGWRLAFATPGGTATVDARNVILTTGAYDRSPRLQSFFDQDPPSVAAGIETVDGGAIELALEAGASFAVVSGQIHLPTGSMQGDSYRGEPVRRLFIREAALPGGIIVNRAGQRFADESFYRDIVHEMTHLDAMTQLYPNLDAHLIVDEAARDKYHLGSLRPGEKPEWLARGSSPEELAQLLGIDGDGLARTISEFNRDAERGEDPRFGRGSTMFGRACGDRDIAPNPNLRPLEGELFAIPIALTTVGGSGGLRFDVDGRVLDWRDRAIEGLYCAGNAGASLVEGHWYNSGIANGRGLVFGHLAATHAAARTA